MAVWAVAELSELFAVGLAVLKSLKLLKTIADDDNFLEPGKVNASVLLNSLDVLIFWAVFAIFRLYELLFEFAFRWVPFYYYCKAVVLVVCAFPKLRIVHLLFFDVIEPIYSILNTTLELESDESLIKIFEKAFTFTVILIFPTLNQETAVTSTYHQECDTAISEPFITKSDPLNVLSDVWPSAAVNNNSLTPPKKLLSQTGAPPFSSPNISLSSSAKSISLSGSSAVSKATPRMLQRLRDSRRRLSSLLGVLTPPSPLLVRNDQEENDVFSSKRNNGSGKLRRDFDEFDRQVFRGEDSYRNSADHISEHYTKKIDAVSATPPLSAESRRMSLRERFSDYFLRSATASSRSPPSRSSLPFSPSSANKERLDERLLALLPDRYSKGVDAKDFSFIGDPAGSGSLGTIHTEKTVSPDHDSPDSYVSSMRRRKKKFRGSLRGSMQGYDEITIPYRDHGTICELNRTDHSNRVRQLIGGATEETKPLDGLCPLQL